MQDDRKPNVAGEVESGGSPGGAESPEALERKARTLRRREREAERTRPSERDLMDRGAGADEES